MPFSFHFKIWMEKDIFCVFQFHFKIENWKRTLMALFIFYFHKKWKEKYSFFRFSFSWWNWKTNYLKRSRLTSRLFSEVWSTHYSKASSRKSTEIFAVQWSRGQNSLFRKQLMYFNVCISCCFFHFFFIVNCDAKNTSRGSHREVFP